MSAVPQITPHPDRYTERFARVIAHLETHADNPLSLDALADLAAFSRFHFQRQFSAHFGMGAHRYQQFMRMRRASWRLAFRNELSVQDVALATGYESPESFARAFRQASGQSPSEFRTSPDWTGWQSRFKPFLHLRQTIMQSAYSSNDVRVVNFPATRVGLLEHRGDPALLGDTIRRFIEWRKANALPPRVSATFNLLHGDPNETPPDEWRLGLGAATDKPIAPNEAGVIESLLPAGRCATLRITGSDDHFDAAFRYLYATWLPSSGEELRDFPLFLQRVKFFPDVADGEAITDIYLPLR
jgi:AraC family transcriptional regulator